MFGGYAFRGDESAARKMITELPYNYNNTLTMRSKNGKRIESKDLPSLALMKSTGSGESFTAIGSVFLESIILYE